jgi:hypothetical protein
MRAITGPRWCLVFVIGLVSVHPSRCAKLPSWRGPDTFFDGSLPSVRDSHGFALCDDGRIYVFGGIAGLKCELMYVDFEAAICLAIPGHVSEVSSETNCHAKRSAQTAVILPTEP